MRRKIRDYCVSHKLTSPEIVVKKGFISLSVNNKEYLKFKSSELAIRLGLSYDDWNGTPIRDLLTSNELKNLSDGKLKWGSLKLEEILKSEESNSTDTRKISTAPCPTRKRESNATGSSSSKLAKMS